MSSAYRTGIQPVVRKVTGWGTGERIDLELPLSPAEVTEALARLTQSERPRRLERKAAPNRPFQGVITPTKFQLSPLRAKAQLLEVRGEIRSRGTTTLVTIDIAFRFRGAVAFAVVVLLTAAAFAALRGGADAMLYFFVDMGISAAAGLLAAIVCARVGIGDVRRTLLEGLRSDDPELEANVTDAGSHALPAPELPDPDELLKRLDGWLREHTK